VLTKQFNAPTPARIWSRTCMLAEDSDKASVDRTASLAGHDECFRAVQVFPTLSLLRPECSITPPAENQPLGSRRHSQRDNAIERATRASIQGAGVRAGVAIAIDHQSDSELRRRRGSRDRRLRGWRAGVQDSALQMQTARRLLGCGHADRLSARAFNGRALERLVGRTRGLGRSPAGAVSPGARRSR